MILLPRTRRLKKLQSGGAVGGQMAVNSMASLTKSGNEVAEYSGARTGWKDVYKPIDLYIPPRDLQSWTGRTGRTGNIRPPVQKNYTGFDSDEIHVRNAYLAQEGYMAEQLMKHGESYKGSSKFLEDSNYLASLASDKLRTGSIKSTYNETLKDKVYDPDSFLTITGANSQREVFVGDYKDGRYKWIPWKALLSETIISESGDKVPRYQPQTMVQAASIRKTNPEFSYFTKEGKRLEEVIYTTADINKVDTLISDAFASVPLSETSETALGISKDGVTYSISPADFFKTLAGEVNFELSNSEASNKQGLEVAVSSILERVYGNEGLRKAYETYILSSMVNERNAEEIKKMDNATFNKYIEGKIHKDVLSRAQIWYQTKFDQKFKDFNSAASTGDAGGKDKSTMTNWDMDVFNTVQRPWLGVEGEKTIGLNPNEHLAVLQVARISQAATLLDLNFVEERPRNILNNKFILNTLDGDIEKNLVTLTGVPISKMNYGKALPSAVIPISSPMYVAYAVPTFTYPDNSMVPALDYMIVEGTYNYEFKEIYDQQVAKYRKDFGLADDAPLGGDTPESKAEFQKWNDAAGVVAHEEATARAQNTDAWKKVQDKIAQGVILGMRNWMTFRAIIEDDKNVNVLGIFHLPSTVTTVTVNRGGITEVLNYRKETTKSSYDSSDYEEERGGNTDVEMMSSVYDVDVAYPLGIMGESWKSIEGIEFLGIKEGQQADYMRSIQELSRSYNKSYTTDNLLYERRNGATSKVLENLQKKQK